MSYLQVEKLTKHFGDRIILDSISLSVSEGEKVALVATNGSGKSTLLKILSGNESYESGLITKQKGVRTAFLDQEPNLDLESTVEEEIFRSESPLIIAVKNYLKCINNPEDFESLQSAMDKMTELEAWEYEERVREILEMLQVNKLIGKIKTFSGGEKKRIALAKILIDNPDFLIMDEPTNHLDIEIIEWLEGYLKNERLTLLMVTHDRYFLERICTKIIELSNGSVYSYIGNYSNFLEKKAIRETNDNTNIDKQKALLRRELEWVRRGPSGRQTKADARVNAYYKLKDEIGVKHETEKIKIEFSNARLGTKILDLHNVSKSFSDKKILEQFTYTFKRGEKVGIIGKNGVGKTTFLNTIMGKEQIDSGKIVQGETVKFGYYTQDSILPDENKTVIDTLKAVANNIVLSDGKEVSAEKMLERFLFKQSIQRNLVSQLSGGERKRLSLLMVLMENPNFLILDEPTNDFDILTLNVLEEFLINFSGCLIIISHDRYFMEKVIDHLFIFEGDGVIRDFPGTYLSYLEWKKSEELSTNVEEKAPEKSKMKKQVDTLYKDIQKLEKRKASLVKKIGDANLSLDDITKTSVEIGKLEKEIEVLEEQWLEMQTNT